MRVTFGILSALPLLLTFLGTRERKVTMEQHQPRLSQSLRAALKNRHFVFGLAIFLLSWIAVDVLQSTLLYFVKYVVQRASESDLIMGTVFVTGMLTLPIWEWASRR